MPAKSIMNPTIQRIVCPPFLFEVELFFGVLFLFEGIIIQFTPRRYEKKMYLRSIPSNLSRNDLKRFVFQTIEIII